LVDEISGRNQCIHAEILGVVTVVIATLRPSRVRFARFLKR